MINVAFYLKGGNVTTHTFKVCVWFYLFHHPKPIYAYEKLEAFAFR